MLPWYCTREDVKDSLEVAHTARADALIDAKIAGASRSVESQLHRPRFAPTLMTVRYDWPNAYSSPGMLELGSNEVISLTEVLAGGTDITADSVLRRGDDTDLPPFNRIEIDLSSGAAFASGSTWQQAVNVTGLFGYSNDEEIISTLSAQLDDTEDATATISWNT